MMNTKTPIALLVIASTALAQVDQEKIKEFYNAGQRLQLEGKHEASLTNFLKVVELDSQVWQARTKVIQEYQALGKIKERDLQRDLLLALRKNGKIPSLSERELYCRDQFTVGTNKVMTLEFFVLQGDRAVRYSFMVLDKTGKNTQFKISLGSYDYMTEFMREKGDLQENERAFHLDGYFPDGEHRTYGFFKGEPIYDDVRRMVVEILEGKRKSVSGMKPTTKGTEIQIKTETDSAPTKPSTAAE